MEGYTMKVENQDSDRRSVINLPQSRNRPLMVDDALQYLEQVRQQFSDRPEVYSNFLEVMKDFKSQEIDTQGVIRRVSQLFGDHPSLITGFNTFLPSGYEVQIHGNILRIIEPTGVINMTMEQAQSKDPIPAPNNANSTAMQPLKVNVEGEDGVNTEDTLDNAVSILSKIRERYKKQPEVYQQFLQILGSYQASVRNESDDRSELYANVVSLFKNDTELIEEFKTFLPTIFNDPALAKEKAKKKPENGKTRKKTSVSMRHPNNYYVLTPKQLLFFEKLNRLKIALEKPSILNAFFHSLELYNHNQITRNDVFNILAPFFKHSPFLLRNLKDIFDQCEAEPKSSKTRLPVELRMLETESRAIDYLTTRRMGQSYREQVPEKRDAVCSGRKIRHRMVLNDKWMAFASWQSEDSAAVSSKKTPFEETLWRIEDERFDYDICESILQASLDILNVTHSKIRAMEPRERRRFKLENDYGCEKTPTLIPRCIKRVYGEHASKILSALRNAPEDSVPCVLKRLEATLEQMRKDKIVKSERWAEQTRACLSRSLDIQANFFRNTDTKFIRCRSIIQDIEKVFEERVKVMEGVTVDGAFPPLVTFEYPTDMTVLFDSHYLIECTLLGQHCTTEELSNARFFLKFILPNLLCVNFTNGGGRTSGVPIESEENDKYPLSYATQLNIPDFTRYIESFIPEGTNLENWSSKLRKCLYYGTNNFILFIRLHNILCERLASIKAICRRKKREYEHDLYLKKQKEEEYQKQGFNIGEYNTARGIEPRNTTRFYNDMLDMVKMLLDTSIDPNGFEDVMRSMFGVDAYPLYTIDKLLSSLSKHLINLLQEPSTIVTFNLFKCFVKRRSIVPVNQILREEKHYEFMSSAVLNGGNCIKVTTVVTDRPVLCFEMIETPNVADWYSSYSKHINNKKNNQVRSSKTLLTYLDDARAIIPSGSETVFLRRNIKKGARRLRSFATLQYNIIEEEEEESRETTPSDEDSDMDTSEPGKSQPPPSNPHKHRSVKTTIPKPEDRETTSFLIRNDLNIYPVNTSFGFFSTHEGSYNVLLKRGAPFRAKSSTKEAARRRHLAFRALLAKDPKEFSLREGTIIKPVPHYYPDFQPSNLYVTPRT